MDLNPFILSSAWLHMCLLFIAAGFFILAGRAQLETELTSIIHKMKWVAGVQVAGALTALIATELTYDDFGNDAGCVIGIAGYGLNVLVLLFLLSLILWLAARFRRYSTRSKVQFIFFLVASGFLSFEAIAIHARSLGYCVGAV